VGINNRLTGWYLRRIWKAEIAAVVGPFFAATRKPLMTV